MRFGEIDYRALENMRKLLEQGTQDYLQSRLSEVEKKRQLAEQERQLANQKQLIDLVGSTAEALKPKKAVDISKTQSVGEITPEKSVQNVEAQKLPMKEVPLTAQQHNRILDEAALRAYGIPGGEQLSQFLYRYRRPEPRDYTVELARQAELARHNRAIEGIAGERNRIIQNYHASTQSIGDLFDYTDPENPTLKKNVPTKYIIKARSDINKAIDVGNKIIGDYKKQLTMYKGIFQLSDEEMKDMGIDLTDPQMEEIIQKQEKLNKQLNALSGGKVTAPKGQLDDIFKKK